MLDYKRLSNSSVTLSYGRLDDLDHASKLFWIMHQYVVSHMRAQKKCIHDLFIPLARAALNSHTQRIYKVSAD